MSFDGQRVQPDRYTIIPRTLTFLLRDEEVLLMRLAANRGGWAGLYNGVGGHIEQGEDPLSAAKRELTEESGLSIDHLKLCGVVIIDTRQKPGIGLYIFVGETHEAAFPHPCKEGTFEWVKLEGIYQLPLVEDLPNIIPKSIAAYKSGIPFSALYDYERQGKLGIHFA
jgi:8-oxo-dGTP diphosphatase